MEFKDRVSAYPNRYIMTTENGNMSYVILERADEPIVPGTPLNAETFNDMFGSITPESIGAASSGHTHDSRYYTKEQTTILLGSVLSGTAIVYLPPTQADFEHCNDMVAGLADYDQRYDTDGDGFVNITDLQNMQKAMDGTVSISGWPYAQKSTVTVSINLSDPNNVIFLRGTNMWGSVVEKSIGFDL